ncbi:cytochrome P450 3A30-like [Clavelina lepadiformis]|uniref:cytochrome P450 3A30-like n=1 Tax=Clavelina lepadiformis TaxID=159417 RepID=UPI00404274F3
MWVMEIFSYTIVDVVVLLVTIVVLIRLYIHQQWQVLNKLNIPHSPPTISGFGNLGELKKDPDSIFKGDLKKKKIFGKVYGSYNGLRAAVTVHDPEILKQIFIKEFPIFSERVRSFAKINGKELNDGLNVVKGKKWKRIRNTLSPSFSASKLKDMLGIMEHCSNTLVKNLKRFAQKDEGRFDTKEMLGRFSLDVVCAAAFGTDAHTQEYEDGNPPKIVQVAQKTFNSTLIGSPIFILVFMFPWVEHILKFFNYSIFPTEVVKYFSSLVDVLLKRRKAGETTSRIDIMQMMLKSQISESEAVHGAHTGLTQNEIVGNSMILMLAGYETTANTLIFLCYNLATHKDAQRKSQKEIDDILREHGSMTYEAVNKLKFLTQCINETLRLYGPIPRNARYCNKDIKINGVQFLKDMEVIVPVYSLNHDEEFWDEPYQFRPERMEDMTKIDPIMFQPFGAGPRNCIGLRFAITEMKVAMFQLLKEFDFDVCHDTPSPPLELKCTSNMRPKEKIFLKVSPRKSA